MRIETILFGILLSCMLLEADEKDQTAKNLVAHLDVYFPVDWKNIDPTHEPIPKLAAVEGYLEFDGTGDFPKITLWPTEEAMKQKKVFSNIIIQSESASPLIVGKFGKGVNSWKVMNGLFVSIQGQLNIEPRVSRHVFIAEIKEIKLITVLNNGMALLEIK